MRLIECSLLTGASMDLVNAGRIGLAAALDRGIALAGTVYIARLDSDDICEGGRLKRQRDYLDRHKNIHVLGGQAIVIGKNSYTPHNSTPSSSSSSSSGTREGNYGTLAGCYPTLPALVHWGMFFKCCIMHPSVMFRRDVVQECGSYSNIASKQPHREEGEGPDDIDIVDFTEDYALWLRILERYLTLVRLFYHILFYSILSYSIPFSLFPVSEDRLLKPYNPNPLSCSGIHTVSATFLMSSYDCASMMTQRAHYKQHFLLKPLLLCDGVSCSTHSRLKTSLMPFTHCMMRGTAMISIQDIQNILFIYQASDTWIVWFIPASMCTADGMQRMRLQCLACCIRPTSVNLNHTISRCWS